MNYSSSRPTISFHSNVSALRSLQHRMQVRAEAAARHGFQPPKYPSSSQSFAATAPAQPQDRHAHDGCRCCTSRRFSPDRRDIAMDAPAPDKPSKATNGTSSNGQRTTTNPNQDRKTNTGDSSSGWPGQLHTAILRVAQLAEVDITAGEYSIAKGMARRTGTAQLPDDTSPQSATKGPVLETQSFVKHCPYCCPCEGAGRGSYEFRERREHRHRHSSRHERKEAAAVAAAKQKTVSVPAPTIYPSAIALLTSGGTPHSLSPYRDQEVLDRIMARYHTPPTPPPPPADASSAPAQPPLHIYVHCGNGTVQAGNDPTEAATATTAAGGGATSTTPSPSSAAAPPPPRHPPDVFVPPPPPGVSVPLPPSSAAATTANETEKTKPVTPTANHSLSPPPASTGVILLPPPPPSVVVPSPPTVSVPSLPPGVSVPSPVPPPPSSGTTTAAATAALAEQREADKEKHMLLEQADKYVCQLEQEVQHRAFHHNVMLQQLAEEEARSAALRRDRDTLLEQNSGLHGLLQYTQGHPSHAYGSRAASFSSSTSSSSSSAASTEKKTKQSAPVNAASPQATSSTPRLPPAVASVYETLQPAAASLLPLSNSPVVSTAVVSPSPSTLQTPANINSLHPPPQSTSLHSTAVVDNTSNATHDVLRHVLLEREVALQHRATPADSNKGPTVFSSLVQSPSSVPQGSRAEAGYSDELQRYLNRLIQEGEAEAAACRQAASAGGNPATPVSAYSYTDRPLQPGGGGGNGGAGFPVYNRESVYPQDYRQPSLGQQALERQRQLEVQQLRAAIATERDRFHEGTRRWNAHVQRQEAQQLRAEAAAEEARVHTEAARWRSHFQQPQS